MTSQPRGFLTLIQPGKGRFILAYASLDYLRHVLTWLSSWIRWLPSVKLMPVLHNEKENFLLLICMFDWLGAPDIGAGYSFVLCCLTNMKTRHLLIGKAFYFWSLKKHYLPFCNKLSAMKRKFLSIFEFWCTFGRLPKAQKFKYQWKFPLLGKKNCCRVEDEIYRGKS